SRGQSDDAFANLDTVSLGRQDFAAVHFPGYSRDGPGQVSPAIPPPTGDNKKPDSAHSIGAYRKNNEAGEY
ncbi:hypothetical protein AAP84_25095, partial [Salmonella enterica subsp. enterica]|nr:hypothetical protein [Salmonella enterica subsp. enterica serovar Litchfield]